MVLPALRACKSLHRQTATVSALYGDHDMKAQVVRPQVAGGRTWGKRVDVAFNRAGHQHPADRKNWKNGKKGEKLEKKWKNRKKKLEKTRKF